LNAINPASIYIVFSPHALVRGKASVRRCSHSAASADNAVREQGAKAGCVKLCGACQGNDPCLRAAL